MLAYPAILERGGDEMTSCLRGQPLGDLLGIHGSYGDYCREERNFGAILYHLLLDSTYMSSFLKLIDQPPRDMKDIRIYFEYAHLRDMWKEVASQKTELSAKNERYRQAIISMLHASKDNERLPLDKDCKKFNEFFIGPGTKASADHIQMPGRWSATQFDAWVANGERAFAERACMLKWAFNAKPDLVLDLGEGKAICIETKLECGESTYSVKSASNSVLFSMRQTELQVFIMEDLLGYETDFVMIDKQGARKDPKPGWKALSWHEVFSEREPTAGESPTVTAFCNSRFI